MSTKSEEAITHIVEQFKSGNISKAFRAVMIKSEATDMPSEKWSFSNRVLAYMQTAELDCRGYRQWEAAKRNVKKGSQAAYIWGPCVKPDPKDKDKTIVIGFTPIPVFSVADTEGEPLPPPPDYSPEQLPALALMAEKLGISVTYQPLPPDRYGDYAPSKDRIRLGTHYAKTFYHELAHAIHNRIEGLKGVKSHVETVADFAACVLMAIYEGEDTTGNTWEYVQVYNPKDPIKAIMKALKTVEEIVKFIEVEAK